MTQRDHPDVAVPPPLLYAAAFVLVLILHWVCPLTIAASQALGWLGVVVLSLGVMLNAWGAYSMIKTRTPINPYRSVTNIVTSGAFRLSRNPLYRIFTGQTLILNNVWGVFMLAPILIVMHYGVILREERYLEAKFGEVYRQYCNGWPILMSRNQAQLVLQNDLTVPILPRAEVGEPLTAKESNEHT